MQIQLSHRRQRRRASSESAWHGSPRHLSRAAMGQPRGRAPAPDQHRADLQRSGPRPLQRKTQHLQGSQALRDRECIQQGGQGLQIGLSESHNQSETIEPNEEE